MEWCLRHLLARIHRYTIDRLRREIEPVSSADFLRFLFDWQKVTPEHRAEGAQSLAVLLEQLEGFEAAAAAWEGELLPARLVEYDPVWLDALCLAGRWIWLRLTPPNQNGSGAGPIRSTPIALLQRKNLPAWNCLWPAPGETGTKRSLAAQAIDEALQRHGASFFAELTERTGLLHTQAEDGLGELAAAGLVTADSFTGLRALLTPSAKRPPRPGGKRRGLLASFGMENAGRWCRLERELSTAGNLLTPSKPPAPIPAGNSPASETMVWCLLKRYGVVFRKLLERENVASWRDLLQVFRRLEARGEIRGGRFVEGYSGEQFALPEAVGLLRSVRRKPASGQLVSVSAADPLNLVGIVTPGGRVPPVSSNRILYRDGIPVAIREAGAVRFLESLDPAEQWSMKNALIRRSVPPQLRAYLGQPA
jgi:ATP-dependent Lhr-like helicase